MYAAACGPTVRGGSGGGQKAGCIHFMKTSTIYVLQKQQKMLQVVQAIMMAPLTCCIFIVSLILRGVRTLCLFLHSAQKFHKPLMFLERALYVGTPYL
jgi:hypothetical protein